MPLAAGGLPARGRQEGWPPGRGATDPLPNLKRLSCKILVIYE